MSTDLIAALLIAERDKLDRAIKALQGPEKHLAPAIGAPAVETSEPSKSKRSVGQR
jgi:hypothetical protein